MTRRKEAFFYIGLIVTLLAMCFFVFPSYIPKLGRYQKAFITPNFFPSLAVSIIVLAALSELRTLWKNRDDGAVKTLWLPEEFKRGAILFALASAYIFLGITVLGFYIATPLFLISCIYYLGERRIWTLLVTSLGMTAAVHALLVVQLKVSLPAGIILDAFLNR